MSVAESIVILRPIARSGARAPRSRRDLDEGSRAAACGRARPRRSAAAGARPSALRPSRHWCSAQCSLSIGSTPRRRSLRPREHQLARHHQRLLVGERHVLARLERAVGGHQAQRAHRRSHHHAGRGRAWRPATMPGGADRQRARRRGPRAGRARRARLGSATETQLGTVARDLLGQHARRSRRRPAPSTWKRSGNASTTRSTFWPTEPVEPRMARAFHDAGPWRSARYLYRASAGGAWRVVQRSAHVQRSNSRGPGAPNSRLSSRSSIPPWPGKASPESFTPAQRLSRLSSRSPTMPSAATATPSPAAWSAGSVGQAQLRTASAPSDAAHEAAQRAFDGLARRNAGRRADAARARGPTKNAKRVGRHHEDRQQQHDPPGALVRGTGAAGARRSSRRARPDTRRPAASRRRRSPPRARRRARAPRPAAAGRRSARAGTASRAGRPTSRKSAAAAARPRAACGRMPRAPPAARRTRAGPRRAAQPPRSTSASPAGPRKSRGQHSGRATSAVARRRARLRRSRARPSGPAAAGSGRG